MFSTESPPVAASRRKILYVFLTQGIAGFIFLVILTLARVEETRRIIGAFGQDAIPLILVFTLFATALSVLKFELTNLIFVSLLLTAAMAMIPLLGVVISGWITMFAAAAPRLFAPAKTDRADRVVERVRTFGLFGTYGIPVGVASILYESIGGSIPIFATSLTSVPRVAIAGIAVIATNNLVMLRVMRSYGYTWPRIAKLTAVDASILLLTIPFSISVTLSYGAIGLGGVLALAFSGIVVNTVSRKLSVARLSSQRALRRMASLSNVGKTISFQFTTEQLLMTIYTECKRVVDTSLFSMALYDERTNELSFELNIHDEKLLPKERLAVGPGLNSWVVVNRRPLMIGTRQDEVRLGVEPILDDTPSESWLGVPMIARDRMVGVISVQSYRKNAFTSDDTLLLSAIASQAAVALENAQLYKDLEGLTLALEYRVLERTNELRETNSRLTAADLSKNQFLANMSHELRTPLNSIIGFSAVLIENTRALLTPRLFKFLENIHTAGNHLLELINDILDLSKIEAGTVELRPDRFDIRDTLASVERVMRGVASEAGVTIVSNVESNVGTVRLDEGRLKQILFNLLSNAVKFSPLGGPVIVSVALIDRPASPLGFAAVRIDVTDHGTGIAPHDLQQIFEEFYQTEDVRRSRRGGTGLGLSLTRNFVELHHGTIEVRSELGRGTTFTLFLPIDIDEANQAVQAVTS